ncbi:hypothetical protein KFL_011490010 [Klebsormidium nitens]|uniref:Uncharacterized protein n=1 Tax=Klebsormidium nitens TaxID=105231 RepID=A0A1Y1ITZ6_KLENI|nr:hypothetical protein KFL_011490010 [Klebsormidium nitens]|eukprot:GAQ92811.1 hypothetical protein KFL_011490010 [Klebsormidium nitens]
METARNNAVAESAHANPPPREATESPPLSVSAMKERLSQFFSFISSRLKQCAEDMGKIADEEMIHLSMRIGAPKGQFHFNNSPEIFAAAIKPLRTEHGEKLCQALQDTLHREIQLLRKTNQRYDAKLEAKKIQKQQRMLKEEEAAAQLLEITMETTIDELVERKLDTGPLWCKLVAGGLPGYGAENWPGRRTNSNLPCGPSARVPGAAKIALGSKSA